MSDNRTAPVQAPPYDTSKTQSPSTDQNAKRSDEARRLADERAGDQSTDQKA